MNPKKIAIFFIGVLLALFAVTFLSGQYKTSQGAVKEGIVLGNTMIKYPTSDILLKDNSPKNSKANQIIEEVTKKKQEKEKTPPAKTDSVASSNEKENFTLENDLEGKIYYPENATEFISQLKEKLQQPNCQIIHYGDSQIEGDRITVYVRNRFQALFGGGGPGFIPIKVAYTQNSVNIQASPNWLRYASFDRFKRKKVPHQKYGLYATLSRFTDYNPSDTVTVKKASFTIKPSKTAYNRLRKFTKFGLHYGNCSYPTKITVFHNGQLLKEDFLKTDGKYHNFKLDFAETPQEIKIELEGVASPDFYGITLDEAKGVRMDNVAMRGEAGRIFTRLNHENFRQMSNERKPDIFIFQFGGNTVPYISQEKQITDYVRSLMQNIKWVKRSNPNASVIVIGPGDMSTSENGKMITYPFLIKLNEEMKNQCVKHGVAFWSIYEAMGGENSMVAWVEKGMAASDYVHLKPKGTQIISELFFQHLHNDIMAIK
ncbi:MAG: lipase [Capnocytophaga felis]|nr:lipase [Capnocytophaga felis]